jgi:excisionase family DNA binding protein
VNAAARPFSCETLGERWLCSAEKIRQMCQRGELSYFRLGKLIRIPASEVERIECNIGSESIEESASSNTPTQQDIAFAGRLARATPDSPRLALVNTGQQSPLEGLSHRSNGGSGPQGPLQGNLGRPRAAFWTPLGHCDHRQRLPRLSPGQKEGR